MKILLYALLALAPCSSPATEAETYQKQLSHRVAPPIGAPYEPIELYPVPPKKTFGAWMYTETHYNEAALTYSPHERLAVGMFGIRDHRPGFDELHYGFVTLTPRVLRLRGDDQQITFFALTGAGMANKLSGVNRFAYLGGGEIHYETPRARYEARAFTLGASDFDQKTFVRARAGITPYLSNYDALRFWLMMQFWTENRADHASTWGPLIRLQMKNVYTEFYTTFKGLFGFALSFYY